MAEEEAFTGSTTCDSAKTSCEAFHRVSGQFQKKDNWKRL